MFMRWFKKERLRADRSEMVRVLIDALNERDYVAARAVIADEVVMKDVGGSTIRGIETFFEAQEAFSAAANHPRLIVDTVDDNDGDVLLRGHLETGVREINGTSFWRFAFSGGKISRIEVTGSKNQMTLPRFANARKARDAA